jgi:hypothetical protein
MWSRQSLLLCPTLAGVLLSRAGNPGPESSMRTRRLTDRRETTLSPAAEPESRERQADAAVAPLEVAICPRAIAPEEGGVVIRLCGGYEIEDRDEVGKSCERPAP